MIAFLQNAEEREVEPLGAIFREYDALRAESVEEFREKSAAVLYALCERDGKTVSASTGVGAEL